MAKPNEKPKGSLTPAHDPEWFEERSRLAQKAINMDLKPRELSRELESLAASGDPMALMVMRRLHRYGMSDKWVNEIDHNVHAVCVFAVPEIDYKTRKFEWRHGMDIRPIGWTSVPPVFSMDYEIFCFVLMRLIDVGIEEVQRCQAPAAKNRPYEKNNRKCEKYFFKRSNKDWCSTTCQVRVSSRRASGEL